MTVTATATTPATTVPAWEEVTDVPDVSGCDTDVALQWLWLHSQASPHTRRAYAHAAASLAAHCPAPLSRLTVRDLETWKAELVAQGLAETSVNRQLTAIKSLLSYAHKTGYLTLNVGAAVRLLPVPDALSERILSEGEAHRLLAAARDLGDSAQSLIYAMYYTGARVSELTGLTWDRVQLDAHVPVATLHGKGGRTRHVALPPCLTALLQDLEQTADGPVWATRTGRPVSPHQVRRYVTRAARAAGLSRQVSPHWLRHAHASHALDRGAQPHVVQATLGHANLATTSRYVHVRPGPGSGHVLAAA